MTVRGMLLRLSGAARSGVGRFTAFPRALRLIWTAAPGWTAAWAMLLLLQGLLPVATLLLTKRLVDALVAALRSEVPADHFRGVLLVALLLAAVMVLSEVAQSVSDWIRTAQSERVQDHVSELVHERAIAADVSFYESPEYHDRLHRALTDASTGPLSVLESGGSVLQNLLTFAATAATLLRYGLWLPLLLFVGTLPSLCVVLLFGRRFHRWWERSTLDRRWCGYFSWLLTDSQIVPEMRVFGLGAHFRGVYQALRAKLRAQRLDIASKQSLARMGAGVGALGISGGILAVMLWRTMHGFLTLGDLALFYQAFNVGQGLLRSLLGNISQIYSNSLFLGNLLEFLELKPTILDPPEPRPLPLPLREGIRFEKVTFRYPGSLRPVLEGFDLRIPAGTIVAIVGPNGAGKSTLVKLLCRFYDPNAGRITLDGLDLRGFALEEYRRSMSVLFQVPVDYYLTARENVALGNVEAVPTLAEVEAAARAAGAHETIARLPRGYETPLGKWVPGGCELSVGQWQRLALARAFLRRAPIMVLDEPTSFMDSWSEADWFERLRSLTEGKTAILITHRFTIAMRADLIYVVEDGRVVESGTHDDLVARRGPYSRSWTEQMQARLPPRDERMAEPCTEAVLSDARS